MEGKHDLPIRIKIPTTQDAVLSFQISNLCIEKVMCFFWMAGKGGMDERNHKQKRSWLGLLGFIWT